MSDAQKPPSSHGDGLARLLDGLRRSPELGPGEPELVQTHISAVLLGRDRALKIKKPVNYGFVNYSTLELRRLACEAEVRLNRRLCPHLYDGVVPVTLDGGVPRLRGAGAPVEWAVLMRRLPAGRMLDAGVAEGWVTEDDVDAVASTLYDFHAGARRDPDVDAHGLPDALRAKWDETMRDAQRFIGRTLRADTYARIARWLPGWMASRRGLLEARVREGRVREGHGDVRCESVCLVDPVAVFDCAEFNESFRCVDVACEFAFLAMDLASRGRPDLAYHLCDRYVARSGDEGAFDVLPFYQAYLAFVRGRVKSYELDDSSMRGSGHAPARDAARRLFDLSLEYATPLPAATLVCVAGLSGAGKTAAARGAGHLLGARVISADAVRHELFGTGGLRGLEHGVGPYSAGADARTYAAMFERARARLAAGSSVVLDATFRRASDREAAASVARDGGAAFRLVECAVPAEVARGRIRRREARREGLSGASVDTYERLAAELEPVDELLPEEHLRLDTTGTHADVARAVCAWLRGGAA